MATRIPIDIVLKRSTQIKDVQERYPDVKAIGVFYEKLAIASERAIKTTTEMLININGIEENDTLLDAISAKNSHLKEAYISKISMQCHKGIVFLSLTATDKFSDIRRFKTLEARHGLINRYGGCLIAS